MSRCLVGALTVLLAASSTARAQDVRLKYIAHYVPVISTKEIVGVEKVLDHHALVGTVGALALVDLDVLPPGGSDATLDILHTVAAFSTFTTADNYVYVNIRLGGMAVVQIDDVNLTLTLVQTIAEPDVFYEKMAIVGDRLYVTAHAYGLRIYDITNRAAPVLVGSLTTGLTDAHAVAVQGNTAYVADGAGGLKIVDITDETDPQIIDGEDPDSAAGTALDVLIAGSHVYTTAGSKGVAVFDLGDLSSRTLYDTPTSAQQMALVGDYLAVGDLGGVQIFYIEPDGSLTFAASELAMRRMRDATQVTTRLWHGVGNWGTNRVLAASWASMDIYELVDPAVDDQADVTASVQRLRFAPAGGVKTVTLTNDGSGPLNMTNIYSDNLLFVVSPTSGTLQPGESMDLTVTYAGGTPGSALVKIDSNDPDENPLPIQVFGDTEFIDPGEPAIPFTLESWTFDHATRLFDHSPFTLSAHAGKIIYFHVFSTW